LILSPYYNIISKKPKKDQKMNEVVKYSNELHELKFNSMNEAQQNVFFTLLQQFRNTDGYTLELDFNKVFELAQIANSSSYRKEILNKLRQIQTITFMYEINDLGDLQQDVIFPSIRTDTQNRRLFVKVSRGFKDRYISSPLKGWTRYELAEFVGLNGTYTKTIYRYLKQFRSSGRWRIRYDDFKELLGIPNSYRARDIDKQILNPSIKELSAERNLFDQRRTPFAKLVVKKHKKGREIETLEFCFMPQSVSELDKDKRQHERNLTIIANDIQKDQTLRQLKRESSKQEADDVSVEELQIYLYRNLKLYDKQFNRYNVVKIQRILAIPNSYGVRIEWQNVDDGFKQYFDLPSAAAAQNFISKYAI
jgi:plasmid replication initiation protein